MLLLLTITLLISTLILIVVAGIRPAYSHLSQFELDRRIKRGDKRAIDISRREKLLIDIVSLQRILVALFLIATVLLLVARFGWLIGILLSVVITLLHGTIARQSFIQTRSQKLYETYEPHLLRFIEKFPGIFSMLRSVPVSESIENRLESREELIHLVDGSGHLLTTDEKQLITHSLTFDGQLVETIMTPRSVIDSVNKSELLGPLALDDLHKTGRSRFPVIDQDIDHVVGVLHVHDLLTLSDKKSSTAETAMDPRVYYIKADQTLGHALAAFIRTHHHLFIVVNEFRETVGLLTLEDVIEVMIGRKILDEFDAHDDLRTVAARNPRSNNHPEKHEDV